MENTLKSGAYRHGRRMKNCANCDAVAQLKMEWRRFDGAKKSFFQLCYV